MDKYEAVRDQIEQARIERSVYLAELLSEMIVGGLNACKKAAKSVLGYARSKPAIRTNVFTFDA